MITLTEQQITLEDQEKAIIMTRDFQAASVNKHALI